MEETEKKSCCRTWNDDEQGTYTGLQETIEEILKISNQSLFWWNKSESVLGDAGIMNELSLIQISNQRKEKSPTNFKSTVLWNSELNVTTAISRTQ